MGSFYMGSHSGGNEKPREKGFSAHFGQRAQSLVFLDPAYGSADPSGTIVPHLPDILYM